MCGKKFPLVVEWLLFINLCVQEVELHEASYYGLPERIPALLSAGVNVNAAGSVSEWIIIMKKYV